MTIFKDYWELREIVKTIIPRRSQLESMEKHKGLVREKGRKVNYSEFSFDSEKFEVKQRMLNKEEITSFIEVSLRAAHCPLPLNSDTYDALSCSYQCKYCLPPLTKIQMWGGKKKNIKDIKEGDLVVSLKTYRTHLESEKSVVTKIMSRTAEDLIVIKIKEKILKLTLEHPVFTSRGWIDAGQLSIHDMIVFYPPNNSNKWAWRRIESIYRAKTSNKKIVYNFECVPNNNYFAEGILVHNCFADSFRSSLYTSFFDNPKEIGIRHCRPEYFRTEMDKLMKFRGQKIDGPELPKAISLQIPIRLGIRFEDFLPIEAQKGISLNFMRYLSDQVYPIMVNTKSALIGREDYVRALADNKAGSAVHMTMISSDDALNKKLEPGAPSFSQRLLAAKALVDAGVRVVARIEPLMIFVNDEKDAVEEWISRVKEIGIKHITFDTYSYSASAPGVKRQMEMLGIDFHRMFLIMSDSQWLGSLVLGEFMKLMKNQGFSSSTFDFGNSPINDDDICCSISDIYLPLGGGFSYGNNMIAARFVRNNAPRPVTWGEYNTFVEERGGWLSETLMKEVKNSWNLRMSNPAYFPDWAQGMEPYGRDREENIIWRYIESSDFRLEMLENLVR